MLELVSDPSVWPLKGAWNKAHGFNHGCWTRPEIDPEWVAEAHRMIQKQARQV